MAKGRGRAKREAPDAGEPLEIGFGRADITAYEPGMAMLGWGMRTNRAWGVAERLHARALLVRDPATGTRAVFVNAELLLISQAVREAVLARLAAEHGALELGPAQVVLTATHTHSGPSGFSHHFWINLASPGYSKPVFDAVVDGIVAAIVAAEAARRPGRLRFLERDVPAEAGLAYNRSWFAFNRNRDVPESQREREDTPIVRPMAVLAGQALDGRLIGLVSWYPLHGTSVHSEGQRLHPDHKGIAARLLEEEGLACAIFAQEAPGDVTPNHRWDKRRGKKVGRFPEDDLASATWVGTGEARFARDIAAAACCDGAALEGPVEAALTHVDFSEANVDDRYAMGPGEPWMGPARIGVSMAEGTAEGPGPLRQARWVSGALNGLKRAADAVRARVDAGYERRHDPKYPLLDVGLGTRGKLLGLFSVARFRLPALDPTFRYVKGLVRGGAFGDEGWIPHILPVQILRLGSLAIVASPFEATTVAGRRLRETVLEELEGRGVRHVVVSSYANAYAGYLTTFEEYQVQHYEAGYTLFGPWQLAAVRTAFADVARQLGAPPEARDVGPDPVVPPLERVTQHAFSAPWPD